MLSSDQQDAYYCQQSADRARNEKARREAKVVANLLVEKGALRLIHGVPVFDKYIFHIVQ